MAHEGITLNGQPLAQYLSEEHSKEIRAVREPETKRWRQPIISRKIRNTSGARSGKVRIIFSSTGGAQ